MGYCPHTTIALNRPKQNKTDQQNTPAFNRNIAGELDLGEGGFPSITSWPLLCGPAIFGCQHF